MTKFLGLIYFFVATTSFAQSYADKSAEMSSSAISSGVKPYVGTDNAGLNRIERIEYIESYLTGLSQTLTRMEAKIQENSELLQKLDSSVALLKTKEIKEIVENINKEALALTEGSATSTNGKKTYQEEIDLLKADILKLKNSDIQNLSTEVQGLGGVIRNLETILKTK